MRQLTKEEAKDIDIDFIYNHRQAVFIGDKVEMCICGHDLYHHLPESSNGCWMKGCKCQFYRSMFSKDKQGVMK